MTRPRLVSGSLARLPRRRQQQIRRTLRRPRWGNLRRLEPISATFGFDRGNPVDRFYIDRFLEREAGSIRGVVGEVVGSHYTDTHGNGQVTEVEVIDIDAANPDATLIADLGVSGSLPAAHFDCLVIVQTLQYVTSLDDAVTNCVRALRPGGTLLLVVPALAPHDDREAPDDDRWRFWPAGLRRLLQSAAPDGSCCVDGYGNLTVALAFLHGLSVEELRPGELAHQDPRFPVVVCARLDIPDPSPQAPTTDAAR